MPRIRDHLRWRKDAVDKPAKNIPYDTDHSGHVYVIARAQRTVIGDRATRMKSERVQFLLTTDKLRLKVGSVLGERSHYVRVPKQTASRRKRRVNAYREEKSGLDKC